MWSFSLGSFITYYLFAYRILRFALNEFFFFHDKEEEKQREKELR